MNFQILGIENMESALTILSIFIFEESSLDDQTNKSKLFLEGKHIDENCIEQCKKKLRKVLEN